MFVDTHLLVCIYIYVCIFVCVDMEPLPTAGSFIHILNSKIFVCFAMERASGSVKKLDKTALEALDSRTETTKVPEEDLLELDQEEADPPSENETVTSTKRSNCKPESHRGPARRAKQARKALVFKGLLTKEEADKLGIDQLDEMVKSYRHKGGSSMLNEAVLKQLEENQKENLMGRLFTDHGDTRDEAAGDQRDPGPPCQPGAARFHGDVPLLQEGFGHQPCEQQESPCVHEGAPAVALHAGPRLRDDFRGGQRNPKPQTLNPFLVLHRVRAGERAP